MSFSGAAAIGFANRRGVPVVSPPVAPVFVTAPVIIGTPQEGVSSAYTFGLYTGNPSPTVTHHWTLDGVDIGGATLATYTPALGSSTHALRVRQTITNSLGSVSSTSASVAIIPSPDDDWVARSTAAGVVRASRLNSALPTANAPGVGAPIYNLLADNPSRVSLDTTLFPTGSTGSLKFACLNSDGATNGSVAFYFGDLTSFGNGETVWFSYRLYAPPEMAYQPWPAPSSGESMHKMSILSVSSGSNQLNEVVPRGAYNRNLFSFGWQDGVASDMVPDLFGVTACSNTDFRWQPEIDRGASPLVGNDPDSGAAWSACAQDRNRYGGLYASNSGTSSQLGYGDPLSGGVRQVPNEWLTVTMRVVIGTFGLFNNRMTMWVARQGQPYVRVADVQNARLGSAPDYNCLWLLPYVTNRIAGGTRVSSRTSNITGTQIHVTGLSTTVGVGTLEYVASTQLFRWKGSGESYGTARGFSAANNVLTINVASATAGSYVTLTVTPGSLPSAGTTTDTVTIASGRPDTQVNYCDTIVSSQAINAPGGYAPADATGATVLAVAAAGMASNSWLQFTSATGQDLAIGHQQTSPEYNFSHAASGTITHYGNKCAWNPVSKKIQIVGSDHYTDLNGIQRLAEYSTATNAWTRAQDDTGITATLSGVRHAGDGTVVNPANGDLYHLVFKANYETPASYLLVRKWNGSVWTSTQVVVLLSGDRPIGAAWWPASGSFSGAGAQGCYIIFNSGDSAAPPAGAATDGGIYAYNPLTDTWFLRQASMMPFYGQTATGASYNSVIAYSAVYNCMVYGGGAGGRTGSQGRQFRRLNADQTSTAMPDFPGTGVVGIDSGNFNCDPVTGKFLALSNGQMWELNPSGSGTWTQLTSPPGGVGGVLDPAGDHAGNTRGILSAAIPDYGITVYTVQAGNAGGSMYLYKR